MNNILCKLAMGIWTDKANYKYLKLADTSLQRKIKQGSICTMRNRTLHENSTNRV